MWYLELELELELELAQVQVQEQKQKQGATFGMLGASEAGNLRQHLPGLDGQPGGRHAGEAREDEQ